MRGVERLCGVLTGVLGLVALGLTLGLHTVHAYIGTAVLRIPASAYDASIVLPVGLAAAASLLVCVGAVLDARRPTGRSIWAWLVVVAAILCVVGVYLLGANHIWVEYRGPPPASTAGVSAGLLFAPAALAGVICGLAALWPRRRGVALD